ncbi:MAG: type II toxin-antitoxin system Phd/YefM family antitoxin [Polyangiaceae bacterium]|nr:type II toxin-antitoxin system Phd/YefM family antitoxin [Polyangiaceae bacterium]
MVRVNVQEAKTNLSAYLERVEAGETVVLCRRNVPIAEMRPIARAPGTRRKLGQARGTCRLAEDFDVLPEELLTAFEGKLS